MIMTILTIEQRLQRLEKMVIRIADPCDSAMIKEDFQEIVKELYRGKTA